MTSRRCRIFAPTPAGAGTRQETKPEKPGELVIGQFESLLIVGNSIKAVEPVVAHLTGGRCPR
jgi:hypothetical protein